MPEIQHTSQQAQHPWPDGMFIQGGKSGVVLNGPDTYRTAFVEARGGCRQPPCRNTSPTYWLTRPRWRSCGRGWPMLRPPYGNWCPESRLRVEQCAYGVAVSRAPSMVARPAAAMMPAYRPRSPRASSHWPP